MSVIQWTPIGDARGLSMNRTMLVWNHVAGVPEVAKVVPSRKHGDPRGVLIADDGDALAWQNYSHYCYAVGPLGSCSAAA